jgi:hypothetical protein
VHVCVTHCEMQSIWQEYEKALQQIKTKCVHAYVHMCVCAYVLLHPLPSPALPPLRLPFLHSLSPLPPTLLPLPRPISDNRLRSPPSRSLPLPPYRRLVRFLKIVSGRWSSSLAFRLRYLRGIRARAGSRTADDACVSMAACTWGGDVPPAACVCRERQDTRRCPRSSQPAVRNCVCVCARE